MTAMKAAWVVCDVPGCDSQHPQDLSGDTISNVERQAKAAGWKRHRDGTHTCPNDHVGLQA
jgi:hypothetical protein